MMRKVVSRGLGFLALIPMTMGLTCAPWPAPSDHGCLPQPAAPTGDDPTLTDVDTLSTDNAAFAFDLYRAIRTTEGNLVYSPYSMSAALGMTYAGARNETAHQMADALHYTLPQDRLHPAFKALQAELSSRGQGAAGSDGGAFRLNIVNDLWGQQDYDFLPDFLNLLSADYGAGLRQLDFIHDPEGSRQTINAYISDHTEQRINDLLPEGSISEDPNSPTLLVLTNAVYFNAAWMKPFLESATQADTFHAPGIDLSVSMMSQTEYFKYNQGESYQVVEMFYDGGQLSMVLILPAEGSFDCVDSSLSAAAFDALIDMPAFSYVHLSMPRFKYTQSTMLPGTLREMGMVDAFSPPIVGAAVQPDGVADFTGMAPRRELYISAIVHKAFISVNEKGTEAAAATAVVGGEATAIEMPPPPIEMKLDRPFIFVIRDIATESILFVGRVLDPAI